MTAPTHNIRSFPRKRESSWVLAFAGTSDGMRGAAVRP
jgi:hypothetical protein